MKERPILFSAPMVRAILAGNKTQTRRIVKPQPEWVDGAWYWRSRRYNNGLGVHYFHTDAESAAERMASVCPYGAPGDRLWVRETFGFGWQDGLGGYSALRPTGTQYERPDKVFFKADFPDDDEKNGKRCWRPSIHMPRWASRITLEVVAVRVERLQDISNSDATAEGFEDNFEADGSAYGAVLTTARESFADLWCEINGPDSWYENPWVWVVEFRSLYGGAA